MLQATSSSFRASKSFESILLLLVSVILFIPKVNFLTVPGFSITAKPEDVLWILLMPWLIYFYRAFSLSGTIRKSFATIISFIFISLVWLPSNIFLALRFSFYSFPLFFNFTLSPRCRYRLFTLLRLFLVVGLGLSLFQKFTTFPGIHTGEIVMGPMSRPSLIYGNAVEYSLVAFFVWQIINLIRPGIMYPCFIVIAICFLNETRLVFFIALLYPIIFYIKNLFKRLKDKKIGLLLAIISSICIFLFLLPLIHAIFANFRQVASTNSPNVFILLSNSLSSFLESASSISYNINDYGYCFRFDSTISFDQSFSMRLSKAAFVIKSVLLDGRFFGNGLGACIGDSADSLFVRLLNDGGIILALLTFIFFINLFRQRLHGDLLSWNWLYFCISFSLLALFYDVIYFSRVSPLVFIVIFLSQNPMLLPVKSNKVEILQG